MPSLSSTHYCSHNKSPRVPSHLHCSNYTGFPSVIQVSLSKSPSSCAYHIHSGTSPSYMASMVMLPILEDSDHPHKGTLSLYQTLQKPEVELYRLNNHPCIRPITRTIGNSLCERMF